MNAQPWTRDTDGALHIVALSGGNDSSALALRLREVEPRLYCYVCTPTGDELPEMIDHWIALGHRLGSRIVPIMASTLNGEIRRFGALPNRQQRWCTRILKIEPYRAWLAARAAEGPVISHVGLRADEQGRAGGAYGDIPGVTMRFPLREWGWGLSEVVGYLDQIGQRIPERTDCARCYHQQLGEWWTLWRTHPDLYAEAEAQESATGHTFRVPRLDADGAPIMATRFGATYATSWRDTWPVRLADMRGLFERGHVPARTRQQRDLFRGAGPCRACTL